MRDAAHHRPGRGGRGDHHQRLRGDPQDRPGDDQVRGLRPRVLRIRRQHLRGHGLHRRAIARHRPRRQPGDGGPVGRRRRPRPGGGGRSGDDVRLRLRRDGRPDAYAHLAGPPPGPPPGRGSQGRRDAVPAARRQDAGHHRVRGQPSGPARHGADLDAAPARDRHRHAPGPRSAGVRDPAPTATRLRRRSLPAAVQSDGYLRAGRPPRRHRPHGAQDHRRHLRRDGPPRRWRLLRQGPHQGGPLGRLRHPPGGQGGGGGRPGPPVRAPGGVRHRQGPARVRPRRNVRDGDRRPGHPAFPDPGALRPPPGGHHRPARSAPADLRKTAAYGHFGRTDKEFTWEQVGDVADTLRKAASG